MKTNGVAAFRVLYLFAGHERWSDIGGCFQELSKTSAARSFGIEVVVLEMDTSGDRFSDSAVQRRYMDMITNGTVDAVFISPSFQYVYP